jgi:hypothetical protein
VELITTQTVAGKLTAYLHHELDLAGLVDWAEDAMMEGEFEPEHHDVVRDVVSRLGLADVKSFALTWDDCERFLSQMGYQVRIEVVAH